MTQASANITNKQWLHLVFALGLLISFFLPWVQWAGKLVNGYFMPSGIFFKTAEIVGGPANPFPQLSFIFYIFWLIPTLALLLIVLGLLNKRTNPLSYIVAALSLTLFTVFFLFSNTLIDLGIGDNVWPLLKVSAYIHALCAIGLVLTSFPAKKWLPKIIWILAGPVLAYGGYKFGEKQVMAETFGTTELVKADYTITANALINEFITNDSAANKKYLDKVIIVNGTVSVVNVKADSTTTVKMEESSGSYVIFSLEKTEADIAKKIQPQDQVSVKGICSGSIFSEILSTTSISFKRAVLNQ